MARGSLLQPLTGKPLGEGDTTPTLLFLTSLAQSGESDGQEEEKEAGAAEVLGHLQEESAKAHGATVPEGTPGLLPPESMLSFIRLG